MPETKSKKRSAKQDSSAKRKASADSSAFNVRETFSGKTIMIIGGTGFLGRIMLYMLGKHAPDVGKLVLVIRPTHGRTGEQRLEQEILGSPVFTENDGDHGLFKEFFAARAEVVEGDASRKGLGIEPEVAARLYDEVDMVLNTAGNVEFNPPLDASLGPNALATREVLDFVEATRTRKYLHVSTCYVADRGLHRDVAPEEIVSERVVNADGNEIVIDVENEIEASLAAVERIRARQPSPADEERYLEQAERELRRTGKAGSERLVKKIAKGLRTFEEREELVEEGRRRAARLNRPNVYTYTKTLAELLVKARRGRLEYTIVRPSIVETSLRYPFPAWNEGIQGSAPLMYLVYRGHIMLPSLSNDPGERRVATLDVIPVDQVAGGTLLAAAALLRGEHREVYQLAAGPVSRPVTPNVLLNITQIQFRDQVRSETKGVVRFLREHVQAYPVSKEVFRRFSSPRMLGLLEKARDRIERLPEERIPEQGRKLLRVAGEEVDRFYKISYLKNRIFDEFLPFMNHGYPVFANHGARDLHGSLDAEERELFPFHPHTIDFTGYLAREHVDAVRRWVFPVLEKRFNSIMNAGSGENPLEAAFEAARELFRPRTLRTGMFSVLRRRDGQRKVRVSDAGTNGRHSSADAVGGAEISAALDDFAFVDQSLRVQSGGRHIASFAGESDEFLREFCDHLELLTGAYFTPEILRRLDSPTRLKEHLYEREAQRGEERGDGRGLKILSDLTSGSLPADGMRISPMVTEPTRDVFRQVQMYFYRHVLRVNIEGAENIPLNNSHVIVVANHCSHLDYGLVWYGLGDYAKDIGIVAARDYFFDKFWKSTFFHNFHNLIPIDRDSESYAEAFEPAFQFMDKGGPLLLFPEGTRSPDGEIQEFKHGAGFLINNAEADVLPVRLTGTFEAFPRGQRRLRARDVGIKIGKLISYEELTEPTRGKSSTRVMHGVTKRIEQAVREL